MLQRVPILSILIALLGFAMLIPSIQATSVGEWRSGRGFLYPALATLFIALSFAVLLRPMREREAPQHELLTLLLAWILIPVLACVPLVLLTPSLGLVGAWFEMMAAFTTTGGTIYPRPELVPDAIHLWRGIVGWLGGLLTLVAAFVILAPRHLGGFEVMAAARGSSGPKSVDLRIADVPVQTRTTRALKTILPYYVFATGVLAIGFNAFDKPGLVAAVHAMSIVSTSGITPLADGFAAGRSFPSEIVAFVFLLLAATRLPYAGATRLGGKWQWHEEPEMRLLAFLVIVSTSLLFVRHWVGVLTIDEEITRNDGFTALWGALFTSLSFLTTTGFESFAWESARTWSGLDNPGLILLCLCMIGGGAATTAGGIKLIRAYALIRHGARELDRIAVPHGIAGQGDGPRALRREGAFIAWAFLMLFLVALMGTVVGLSLTGIRFERALIAAIASLSNTGPAYEMILGGTTKLADFGAVQQGILAAAMLLGRIETLAFIALFSIGSFSGSRTSKNTSGKSRAISPSWRHR
ncbi:MAG: potassium transporter TrkG [Pseudomonadota bacterium]